MIEKKDPLTLLEQHEPLIASENLSEVASFAGYEMAGYAFLVAAYRSLECAEKFSHEGTDGVIREAKKLIEDWFEGFTQEEANR